MKLKTHDEILADLVNHVLGASIANINYGDMLRTLSMANGCRTRGDIEFFVSAGMSNEMILQGRPAGVDDNMFVDEIVWARTRITLEKLDLT